MYVKNLKHILFFLLEFCILLHTEDYKQKWPKLHRTTLSTEGKNVYDACVDWVSAYRRLCHLYTI